MFDKFGEMGSYKEINELAENLFNENYLYVNGARITNFKFIHPLTAIEIVEKGGIE